jgi:hypothetical protein
VTQEYISKTWLLQNIRLDMKAADMAKVIENAPIVEFDPDEPPRHGRCRRCSHYKGAHDGAGGPCDFWPGFVSADDWCSNFGREEE